MNLHLACAVTAALLVACASPSVMQATTAPQPVAASTPHTRGKTEVLWLGQSATRITTPGGKVLLIDPWLATNPRTPAQFKTPDGVGKVDLILVTHAHPDHFSDAAAFARANNAKMVVQSDFGASIIANNLAPAELVQRLHKGGTITPFGPAGIKISMVHADHSSLARARSPGSSRDDLTYPGGDPVGYVIEMENGFKVWHTGDTALFGDMELIAKRYRPDLVMISMDGFFTMNASDAAYAMNELVKPKFVIPIHWGTTPEMTATPAHLKSALGSSPVQMIGLEPGQKAAF